MENTAEKEQPLTPAGRLFLQTEMDQVINAAIELEHPYDVETIKTEVKNSLMVKHPRFCSLLVRDGGGREFWRKIEIDVDQHVIVRLNRVIDDSGVSDCDAVNDYIADLTVSSPLPIDKPLWEMHLLLAHKTIVLRVHHALGDGISLMSLLMSCCRRIDDPAEAPPIVGVGSDSSTGKKRWSLLKLAMVLWFTFIYVVEFIARILFLRDKDTVIRGGAGVELWPRRLATARFRLDDMKIVKGTLKNATINDVLFGVISSGLSRYLDITSPQSLREGLRVTGLAMVNLRPQSGLQDLSKLMKSGSESRWGNKFGFMLLPLYYYKHGSDPIQFMKRSKSMLDNKKLSLEALLTYQIGNLILSLLGPKVAALLNYRVICNTSFTMSNIVGPREKMMMANIPMTSLRVTSSSLPHAITMHMISYAGIAEMQILVAKEIVPDPHVLARCFEDALLDMKRAATCSLKDQSN